MSWVFLRPLIVDPDKDGGVGLSRLFVMIMSRMPFGSSTLNTVLIDRVDKRVGCQLLAGDDDYDDDDDTSSNDDADYVMELQQLMGRRRIKVN